jgi:hypothetical protein
VATGEPRLAKSATEATTAATIGKNFKQVIVVELLSRAAAARAKTNTAGHTKAL